MEKSFTKNKVMKKDLIPKVIWGLMLCTTTKTVYPFFLVKIAPAITPISMTGAHLTNSHSKE